MDGWMGGWRDRWLNTELYQERSRNGMLEKRDFIPKTATMIKNPKFSKVEAKLGACRAEKRPDKEARPTIYLSLSALVYSTEPGSESYFNVFVFCFSFKTRVSQPQH